MNPSRHLKAFLIAALMPLSAQAQASGLPPLAENERVVQEFLAAAVGDQIRKNCGTIAARFFYVMQRARELEEYALSLGYTEADIDAMRDDPAAKARLREMRDRYLAENGVVAGDEESYCRLGRREMENGTLIGSLLR